MLRRFAVVAGLFLSPVASGQNIVIVVIDDAGIERFGTYDVPGSSPPPTLTIDSIAATGVKFDNFWAYPTCSPFRASLITGLTPWEHRVSAVLKPAGKDGRDHGLDVDTLNIAQMVKTLDPPYRTEAIGKWHMAGKNHGDMRQHPIDSGFDYFDGALFNPTGVVQVPSYTVTGHFAWERCRGTATTPVNCEVADAADDMENYSTRYVTNKAIDCVTGTEPFLCYVAYPAAHEPFGDPPDSLYPNLGDGSCTPNGTPESACHKEMIEALDRDLGDLVGAIDFATTTLFVVSDNGTPSQAADGPYPEAHGKVTVYQGGLNTPLIVKGQAVTAERVGTTVDVDIVQTTDIFATIAEIVGWSDYANHPRPDSRSLLHYLDSNATGTPRETVTAEIFLPTGPTGPSFKRWFRSSREACYKLIWNFEDGFFTSEAYDLCADEFEQGEPLDPSALEPEIYETLLTAIRNYPPDDDWDDDGIVNSLDNCQTNRNPSQDDSDRDGCGNLCDADYDNSGTVGFRDFGQFGSVFGTTGNEGKCHVEPIAGCTVGFLDFNFFAANFGRKPGPSGTTSGTTACP